MRFSLEGKVAIITGASRGIGRGIALGFAEQGADLVLASRSVDALAEVQEAAEALGRRAVVVETDMFELDQVARPVEAAVNEFGRLDVLVNNAGGAGTYIEGAGEPFFETPIEAVDKLMQLNVIAPVAVTRAAAEVMRDQGRGSIINLTSLVAMIPRAKLHGYSAAKAAMAAFTIAWAEGLGPYGIRVNAISPGGIESGNSSKYMATPELRSAYQKQFPIGRIGQPIDAAACAIFLASDEAAWVSGATILLSGARLW